jgi:hypothetical protein
LESSHKYNKYDFKEHGERSEHLQFEYNCRNVLLDLSYEIEFYYTVDTYYICVMTIVVCMGIGTSSM